MGFGCFAILRSGLDFCLVCSAVGSCVFFRVWVGVVVLGCWTTEFACRGWRLCWADGGFVILGLLGLCRWVWCWFGVLLIELVCLLSSGVGGFCWFTLSCGVFW